MKEEVIGEGKDKEVVSVVIEAAEVEEAEDHQSATNVVKTGILDMSALHVATNANYANVRVT